MKLAAIYNVFDGEELLPFSINSVRNCVDIVIVVYQAISNYGLSHPEQNFEQNLLKLDFIDKFVKYEPIQIDESNSIRNESFFQKIVRKVRRQEKKHTAQGYTNELNKRILGVEIAKELGCTHFLHIDCDEFYAAEQFQQARKTITKINADSSACQMRTFYKNPTYQINPPEEYYVSFIHKIQEDNQFGAEVKYPVMVDPTRKISPNKNFIKFERLDLEMYHYSYIRKNIRVKFENSSAQTNYKNVNKMVQEFNDFRIGDKLVFPFEEKTIKVVDNTFKINFDTF